MWSPLGSGVAGGPDPEAKTLRGIGSRLYVGGAFTTAGGGAAANIASWNGSAWSPLAGGAAGPVEKLAAYDDGSGSILAATGFFDNLGGTPAARLATWNGSAWSALGLGVVHRVLRTLIQFDQGDGNALFVGGRFATIGGAHPGDLRRWHDGAWSVVTAKPGHGLVGSVREMTVHDDGGGKKLYVAGQTPELGGIGVNSRHWLIQWDGASWALAGGQSNVGAMLSYDDGSGSALYVSTSSIVGPVILAQVTKWNGATWTSLAGSTVLIRTMAEYDDGNGKALYAAGSELPGPPNAFDSNIAKWDGTSWSAVGAGIFGAIDALAAGHALYVAGTFATAGGVPAPGIAKWNGTAWSPVGGGASGIFEVAVFDDGAGSALYVNGPFTTLGGKPIAKAARWDGTSWTPIGTGGDAPQGRMAVYDPGFGEALFFGGDFTAAGGIPSFSFAQFCRPGVFQDGFESGDISAWSQAVP